MKGFTRLIVQAVSLAVVAASVTACNAQKVSDSASPGAQGSTAPLYRELPSSVQAAGTLKLGTDATSEPFAIVGKDGHTIEGINADMAQAVQPLLGVNIDLENVAFDQSVPSVQTHRVDAYWDWSTDRPEKRAQVDLIDFATTGAGLLVAEGNPKHVGSFGDLCGGTVAVQEGSNNVDITKKGSDVDCVGKGRSPISILTFESVPAALLQIKQGRAEAVVTAYAVCAYLGKQSPDYDLAGAIIGPARAGITVAKDRTDMRSVLQKAIQQLMDSGKYKAILDKWGIGGAAISKATINDGA